MPTIQEVRALGIGWVLALLVLVACFVLFLIGQTLTPAMILILIGMLALARLL